MVSFHPIYCYVQEEGIKVQTTTVWAFWCGLQNLGKAIKVKDVNEFQSELEGHVLRKSSEGLG